MKKDKGIIIVMSVFIVGLLAWQQYIIRTSKPTKEDILIEKITELESKIDSLSNKKDSIKSVIDSTHVKIVTNEKHFKEKINTIITQPDTCSESFTRQYLRDYASARGYRITGTSETK